LDQEIRDDIAALIELRIGQHAAAINEGGCIRVQADLMQKVTEYGIYRGHDWPSMGAWISR
jgi:hypothetical protein